MVLVWANPAAFTNHDGQGAAHHIPKCQGLGSPRAARQALGEGLRREVVQVQKDVVLVWANSAAFVISTVKSRHATSLDARPLVAGATRAMNGLPSQFRRIPASPRQPSVSNQER